MGASSAFSSPGRAAARFAAAVLGGVTWRIALATQLLGLLFATTDWLSRGEHVATRRLLVYLLCAQAVMAMFAMLAALAGDEIVRRGWRTWRAFVVVLLCASVANVVARWMLDVGFGVFASRHGPAVMVNDFFDVGLIWGTALMVYLNRQSTTRFLWRLRDDELERAHAERRVIASRIAVAEAGMDPALALRRLAEIRELYAAGVSGADRKLEELIDALRSTVARCAAVERAAAQRPETRW